MEEEEIKLLKELAPKDKKKWVGRYEELILNKEKENEKIEENKELEEIRVRIYEILANPKETIAKKKVKASEILVEYILEHNHIYTIRESRNNDKEIWIYHNGIYIPNGDTYINEICRKILRNAYSISLMNLVLAKIEVDTYVSIEDFFKEEDPYILPVANGLLNLKTKELEEFDPNKKFFNKLNIRYNPIADCPKIKKFISEIVREQDVPLIQEMFGFSLVRSYFLKKAYMLLGRTDAGKTKLLLLLHHFLGYKNCSSVPLHKLMEDNFLLWKLHGKLANISGDSSSKSILNDDLFKRLVGEDPITADRKFKEAIEFMNYAKIINACNDLPKTYTYDNAFFNRWILIKFPNQFIVKKHFDKIPEEERKKNNIFLADENILDKIIDPLELEGLLNWALEGLDRLFKKGFSYNKTADEIKLQWLRESNSFEAFFMDELEETKTYDFFVTKEELKNSYKNYCKKHKLKIESDKIIKNSLEKDHGAYEKRITARGEEDEGANRIRVWKGVRFKENED